MEAKLLLLIRHRRPNGPQNEAAIQHYVNCRSDYDLLACNTRATRGRRLESKRHSVLGYGSREQAARMRHRTNGNQME